MNAHDEQPDEGYIYENWLTTKEVVELTNLNSTHSVVYAIKTGRLIGYKLKSRGYYEWRVDPESLEGFKRYAKGRKPK